VVPFGAIALKLLRTSAREPVDTSPPSVDPLPPARDKPSALKPIQARIDRSLGQVERAAAALAYRFCEAIPVRILALEDGQEEQIDVATEPVVRHALHHTQTN